ncbi:rhodanese-like domain-containing protein [Agromyces endophyticus]|uniref:rhodanese-like domain-containing protein n=1 Tax=Agromyces sp. H17E-10 TaxID=2932244 RepID=UPI001FD3E7D9|nr:rhodanese-like domain-containing protein [Agromyces sp. H17E-10]UOQ88452.1 rhodanese-like domain-containing protein [Agromyces sp. H17E-10]
MRSLSPTEVHATDDAYLIDVREAAELEQARIDGAHHIPLGELVARLDEVPRDRTVYVLCHVGGRSAQAVVYLEQQGVDAVNVDGGIVGWYREGLPVELGGAS